MQGLAVVPLFAGYDLRRGGRPAVPVRRHRRPLRGDATTPPPARAACTPAPSIKLGFREGLSREATLDLAINALFKAADEDSATGGPDLVRGIYPTWPPSPPTGFERVRRRRDRRAVQRAHRGARRPARPTRRTGCPRPRPTTGAASHEHALLRRPRAGDEGPGRLRPQGHRPGPQPGRRRLRRGHPDLRREPVDARCARSARSTTASPSPASASTTSSTSSASPASATPTSRATRYSREDVDARSLANQYAQILGQVFTHEMKPMEVEILVAEVGADAEPTTSCSTSSTTARSWTRTGFTVLGGEAEAIAARLRGGVRPTSLDLAGALTAAVGALAGPDRTLDRRRARGRRARAHRRPPGLPPHRGRRAHRACSPERRVDGQPMASSRATTNRRRPRPAARRPSSDRGRTRTRARHGRGVVVVGRLAAGTADAQSSSSPSARRALAGQSSSSSGTKIVDPAERVDAVAVAAQLPHMPSAPRRAASDLGLERRRPPGHRHHSDVHPTKLPADERHGAGRCHRIPVACSPWSGASSASRTSTASPARSAASAA